MVVGSLVATYNKLSIELVDNIRNKSPCSVVESVMPAILLYFCGEGYFLWPRDGQNCQSGEDCGSAHDGGR